MTVHTVNPQAMMAVFQDEHWHIAVCIQHLSEMIADHASHAEVARVIRHLIGLCEDHLCGEEAILAGYPILLAAHKPTHDRLRDALRRFQACWLESGQVGCFDQLTDIYSQLLREDEVFEHLDQPLSA